MGVLYEHWRPDLNECFYVGASWANPETRPYEMSGRGDDHIRIQEELAAKGLAPEVKVIDCSWLLDEELDELEALQITYWKELIGDRLVNIAKGGRTGWGFAWSDTMKDEHSDRMSDFYQSEAGSVWREERRKEKLALYASEKGQELKDRIGNSLAKYYSTPEGRAQIEKIAKDNSARMAALYASPEGDILRKRQSEKAKTEKLEFYQSERGKKTAQEQGKLHSVRLLEMYASPRGEILRKEQAVRASQRMMGSGNPNSLILEETAQAILDAEDATAKELAKKFDCSTNVVHSIKTRNSWCHLEPTSGVVPKLIDGRKLKHSEENNARNKKCALARWNKPEYRTKMMYRDWDTSNKRHQPYWGA